MNPLKLRVRIGKSIFDAEGDEKTVVSQFQTFVAALPKSNKRREPTSKASIGKEALRQAAMRKWSGVTVEQLQIVFERGGDWTVRFRQPPKTEKPINPYILLVYAIQAFRNLEQGPLFIDEGFGLPKDHAVSPKQLLTSAKDSGLEIDRIDRVLLSREANGLVWTEGEKRGSCYGLTSRGIEYATKIIDSMIADLDF